MSKARELAGRGNYDTLVLDASSADTDVGEQILLDSSDGSGSDIGFAILQEDATDNADVEVTSFIDPNDVIIFTSAPKNPEIVPMFKAHLSADQTNSNGTFTKIGFDDVSLDTTGEFDTTNNRYQPSVPGYYRFMLQWYEGNIVDSYAMICLIYKNGLGYQSGGAYSRFQLNGASGVGLYANTLKVSQILYMDGTDYVEGYSYNNNTSGQAVKVFRFFNGTIFSGHLVQKSNISPQSSVTI